MAATSTSSSLGDGADRIGAAFDAGHAVPPSDFIRFGPGITASSLQVIDLVAGSLETAAQLVIRYGNGDSISFEPGAESQFAGIRFHDGSVLAMNSIAAMAILAEPTDGVQPGPASNDTLLGGRARSSRCTAMRETICSTAAQDAMC